MPAQICLPRSQGLVSAFHVLDHHLPDVKVDITTKVVRFTGTAFTSLDCDHVHWNFSNSVIRASEFITDKFCGRVLTRYQSRVKSDLETRVAELATIRDKKEKIFGDKVNDEEIRSSLYPPKEVTRLETLAAYAALFSREKREFMKGLLHALKDLSSDDLNESVLNNYEKLDDLLAYAKSEKFFLSYDEIFDDLFTNYLNSLFVLHKGNIFDFVRKINSDIEVGKYDFKYLLFDYYFQKKALQHVVGVGFFRRADPRDVKSTYEKIKSEGLKTDRVVIIECFRNIFEFIFRDLLINSTMTEFIVINSDIPRLSKSIFKGCKNLKLVFISGCQIEALDSYTFSRLPHLQYISICDSHIQKIKQRAINQLPELCRLDFSETIIDEIEDKSFSHLPKLTHLIRIDAQFPGYRPEIFEEVSF